MSCPPWIWMYLNEQIPMVCLGCLENKYFPRDLIFGLSKKPTEPSGTQLKKQGSRTQNLPLVQMLQPKTYIQWYNFVREYETC